ncbi:MAG: P-loop NTPase fold protein [Verrucomicrobiota bacterium]
MSDTPALGFEDDLLGLHDFAAKLENYLLVEHDFVDGSLVVQLNGTFGAGKTTFLEMWSKSLQHRRDEGEKLPAVIKLNAWIDDYCSDPLVSITSNLASSLGKGILQDTNGQESKLREIADKIAWYGLGFGNSLVKSFTGIDGKEIVESVSAKVGERRVQIPDFVALHQDRVKTLSELKTLLRELCGGNDPKVFVFVDELDRCRPNYAIEYIETIKHIFDIKGMVFVLAADGDQLAQSAKALFGSELDTERYFRKFIHREIPLPPPSDSSLLNLSEVYWSKYLAISAKRQTRINLGQYARYITELLPLLNLPPRDIQEIFRVSGHVATSKSNSDSHLNFGYGFCTILMATLRVTDTEIYRRLGTEAISPIDFCNFLKQRVKPEDFRWWANLYITGIANTKPTISVKQVMEQYGLDQQETHEYARAFWGRFTDSDPFQRIYEKIETLSTFAE